MKKILLCSMLLSLPGLADPPPPRMRIKEDRLQKMAADKKRAEKNPWTFTAPDGFTVTEPDPKATEAPDFVATSLTPAATMTVVVEKGAVTIDDALLAGQPKTLTDKFVAAHAGGTAKVIKKELVKLDDGSATRVVLETRADAKKAKPMREVHYLIGNATHHAHVTYTTASASFAKLEKKFDESLRKTKPFALPVTP